MGRVGAAARPASTNGHFNSKRLRLAVIAGAFAAGGAFSQSNCAAAPDTWIGAAGSWSVGANWSLGHSPSSSDDAIDNTGADIELDTSAVVNSITTNGTFDVINGSQLGGAQPSEASVLEFDNIATMNSGGIYNATISSNSNGSLSLVSNGGNYLQNDIVNSFVNVGAGYVQLYNSIAANGLWAFAGGNVQLRDGNTDFAVSGTGELRGTGLVNESFGGSTLANSGLVSADVPGQALTLSNSIITGAGTYQAVNGGTLQISGDLAGANTIVHGDTGTVLVNGGGVTGTIAQATGAGISFAANGADYISSATIDGNLTFGPSAYAQVYNVNSVTGTVNMASTGNGIQLRDGNAKLTLTSGSFLQGYGTVYESFSGSVFENDGAVSATVASQTIFLNNSYVTGAGTLSASGGGVISIGAQLNGNGMQVNVDSNPNSLVEINGGGLTGTLGTTTGTGLSFAPNGSNYISSATVNGTLTFAGTAYAQVYNTNTINGTITMSGTGNGIQLRDGNALLGISSGALLHGYGTVYQNFGGAVLQNNGTVNADVSAQSLALNNSNITGSGIFEGTGGGTLAIGGLLNGSNATVHADTGTVIVNGGGVAGTFAASTGAGISFAPNGNNYMSNATVDGNLTFAGTAYVQVYNVNQVGGTIAMSTTGNGIQLRDGNASLQINSGALMHGYGNVFQNFGGSVLINDGTISADQSGQILGINNSNLTGNGILDARNGGVVSIGALLNASGMQVNVDSNPSSAVEINGGGLTGTLGATTGTGLSFAPNGNNYISGATVNGTLTFAGTAYAQVYNANTINGNIAISTTGNGIQLRDGNASLNISHTGTLAGFGSVYQNFGGATINNAGMIVADTPAQTLSFGVDNTLNTGTIDVGSSMLIQGSFTQTAGLTMVDGTLQLLQPFALNGGTLDGTGIVTNTVNNLGGIVSPGDAPGILTINSNYNQGSLGELDIQLGGYLPGINFSQLDALGNATLNGNLNVDLVNNFFPHIGDIFNILLSQDVLGTFSSTTSSYQGLTYSVIYQPTIVQIQILSVPEPTALGMFAGLLFLLPRRRRRQKSVYKSLHSVSTWGI